MNDFSQKEYIIVDNEIYFERDSFIRKLSRLGIDVKQESKVFDRISNDFEIFIDSYEKGSYVKRYYLNTKCVFVIGYFQSCIKKIEMFVDYYINPIKEKHSIKEWNVESKFEKDVMDILHILGYKIYNKKDFDYNHLKGAYFSSQVHTSSIDPSFKDFEGKTRYFDIVSFSDSSIGIYELKRHSSVINESLIYSQLLTPEELLKIGKFELNDSIEKFKGYLSTMRELFKNKNKKIVLVSDIVEASAISAVKLCMSLYPDINVSVMTTGQLFSKIIEVVASSNKLSDVTINQVMNHDFMYAWNVSRNEIIASLTK